MKRIDDTIIIRPLAETDSLEELTDLLHRSYKILADMGLRYLATYQDVSVTKNRIERGECFVAEDNGRIVGTVCFYMPEAFADRMWPERDDIAAVGQLGIDPDYQKQGIGARLMRFVEEHAIKKGIRELALDTSEKATHLIAWYEKLGYRYITTVSWDITNYRSVVMRKTLGSDPPASS